MLIHVRRVATVRAPACTVGAALTARGTPGASHAVRPAPAATSATSAAPSRPPTLTLRPAGLPRIFENGPRTHGKTVALTFDADMTADEGPRAAAGERFDNPQLIATLRRLKVPATLFMTGRWAEYPQQTRSIGRDPQFEVANHSYSHDASAVTATACPACPRTGCGRTWSGPTRRSAGQGCRTP